MNITINGIEIEFGPEVTVVIEGAKVSIRAAPPVPVFGQIYYPNSRYQYPHTLPYPYWTVTSGASGSLHTGKINLGN